MPTRLDINNGNAILASIAAQLIPTIGSKTERCPMPFNRLTAVPAILSYVAIAFAMLLFVQMTGATTAHAQSLSACETYAHNQARRATRGTTTSSMARNAIGGAVVGSLIDGRSGARRGANLGLGAGLISGNIAAYNQYETEFNRAFRRCMRI
jgi:hypothetical protein